MLALVAWIFFLAVADKERVPEYIPVYLFPSVTGFALDVYFSWGLGAYAYTTGLGEPLATIIMELLATPGLALLYVHFLPGEKPKILLYTLAWTGILLITEYLFLLLKELTFYRWNLAYSALLYLATFGVLIWLSRLYAKEKRAV